MFTPAKIIQDLRYESRDFAEKLLQEVKKIGEVELSCMNEKKFHCLVKE